jgi:hypothetical protein
MPGAEVQQAGDVGDERVQRDVEVDVDDLQPELPGLGAETRGEQPVPGEQVVQSAGGVTGRAGDVPGRPSALDGGYY